MYCGTLMFSRCFQPNTRHNRESEKEKEKRAGKTAKDYAAAKQCPTGQPPAAATSSCSPPGGGAQELMGAAAW